MQLKIGSALAAVTSSTTNTATNALFKGRARDQLHVPAHHRSWPGTARPLERLRSRHTCAPSARDDRGRVAKRHSPTEELRLLPLSWSLWRRWDRSNGVNGLIMPSPAPRPLGGAAALFLAQALRHLSRCGLRRCSAHASVTAHLTSSPRCPQHDGLAPLLDWCVSRNPCLDPRLKRRVIIM